jgi:hypothetical protein
MNAPWDLGRAPILDRAHFAAWLDLRTPPPQEEDGPAFGSHLSIMLGDSVTVLFDHKDKADFDRLAKCRTATITGRVAIARFEKPRDDHTWPRYYTLFRIDHPTIDRAE